MCIVVRKEGIMLSHIDSIVNHCSWSVFTIRHEMEMTREKPHFEGANSNLKD